MSARRCTRHVAALAALVTFVGGWGVVEARATSELAVQDAPRQDVIITLRAQADLPRALPRGRERIRREAVIRDLRTTARESQRPLMALLDRLALSQQASAVRPLWISNVVAASLTPQAIELVRRRPDVESVTSDVALPAPTVTAGGPAEPNLVTIGAPALWAQGLTGAGVVVAVLDTGVDVSHPDLAPSWRGGANSWFDPYGEHVQTPVDVAGHGTWVAGLLAGRSNSGAAVGVAPDVSWIAARVFDDRGTGTVAGIHAALQWAVDPDRDPSTNDAADVVTNSWGFSAPGCNLAFQPDLSALRSLGIVPVFSAGNGGPAAGSDYSPANYPEALSVGAVTATDAVLPSSSRGPAVCGGRARPFPDLVAPGEGVHTTDLFSLWTTQTGTSLAAPQVAGSLALLMSNGTRISGVEAESLLTRSALELGPPGPDDTFGVGRIDVSEAWSTAQAEQPGPWAQDVSVTPDPANLDPPATVTASTTVGRSAAAVTGAELFVDAVGADGSGTAMDGPDPSGLVSLPIQLPLTEGTHTIYVHAEDAAGHWGPYSSGAMVVDRTAPLLSGLAAEPTSGTVQVRVTLSETNGVDDVQVSEPGLRVPSFETALTAEDGAFDSATEVATATLDASGWAAGEHRLSVTATDRAGNVSTPAEVSAVVGGPEQVFADGFETGGTLRWSRSRGRHRMNVSTAAAVVGTQGLAISAGATGPAFVEDRSPAAAATYHARFWLAARCRGVSGPGAEVFEGRGSTGQRLFAVSCRRSVAGGAALRVAVVRSPGHLRWSRWIHAGSGPHRIGLDWAANAQVRSRLTVDGRTRTSVRAPSDAPSRLDVVRLGIPRPTSPAKRGGAESAVTVDAFVSW